MLAGRIEHIKEPAEIHEEITADRAAFAASFVKGQIV
jgi:hypothetical protein